MSTERFDFEKISDEKLVLGFDFSNNLATDEILLGVPAVSVRVARGVDAHPELIINGDATLDGSKKIVLLPVKGGVKGVEYLIRVVAPTNNVLKVFAIDAILPVI